MTSSNASFLGQSCPCHIIISASRVNKMRF
jgi:hypothetical protein